MKKTNKKRGFTIIELVIVIAVIAILAGVLIPTFSSVIEKANKSNRLQTAREALVAVLADQQDAALDGAIFEITEGSTKYYYTYKNGEFSTTETSGETAPTVTVDSETIATSGTYYHIVFAATATADTINESGENKHTIVESTLSAVNVYIFKADFEQAGK